MFAQIGYSISMSAFSSLIGATLLISAGSLIGALTLFWQGAQGKKVLLLLVGLSAGALIGNAFLHLLPEAAESLESVLLFRLVLVSFVVFFLIEKVLHWRHCHNGVCPEHSFGTMNLIGDFVHNFIDGLILAATFAVDVSLGWVTALAVAMHEIPQEISDFGVLLYSGFSRGRALAWNLFVSLGVVFGGIVGWYAVEHVTDIVPLLLPIAAGGFLYIAASDLMPELRRETQFNTSALSFMMFLIGVAMMFVMGD